MRKALSEAGRVRRDQSGITGLETAIVLIAFIVVAAVFAFAVLTTGLFTTERAKDTTISAVGEAQSTLSPKGAVFAQSLMAAVDPDPDPIDRIIFKLANASGAEAVDLGDLTTLLTYTDQNVSVNASHDAAAGSIIANPCGEDDLADADDAANALVCWDTEWIIGGGPTVDGGEIVEFTVNVRNLGAEGDPVLLADQKFKIEVIPGQGAVIPISRKTPLEITAVMNLE